MVPLWVVWLVRVFGCYSHVGAIKLQWYRLIKPLLLAYLDLDLGLDLDLFIWVYLFGHRPHSTRHNWRLCPTW